jgi:hypothetical protein
VSTARGALLYRAGKPKATLISTDADLATKIPATIRKMEKPPRILDEPSV